VANLIQADLGASRRFAPRRLAFFAAAHESVCGQTDALTQMRPQRSRQIVIVRQRRKGDGGHV
jgi:hypothetical protein